MGINPREWSEGPSSTGLMSNDELHQLRESLSTIGTESAESDANLLPARYRDFWDVGPQSQQQLEGPSSTGLMSNDELHQLREYLLNVGNESRESDANLLPARYRDPGSVDGDLQQWSERLMSTSSLSNEEIQQLRECLLNVGNESRESDANLLPARYRDPGSVDGDLQQWSERLMSTSSLSNEEIQQLRECLLNVGNESGGNRRGSGGYDGGNGGWESGYSREELEAAREELEERLRSWEMGNRVEDEDQEEAWEHDGGHSGGNGGGDGGHRGAYDGYESDSDEDDKNGSDAQKLREAAAKLEENWEGRTFRSAARFAGHCRDHLSEWSPPLTAEQYLEKARELLSAPPDANIEGFVSESGKFIYKYNNATNEFAIGMIDGVISTFYKPVEGRAYWLSEIEKNGGPHVFGGK
jgi:hypothetical protein